MTNFDFYRFPLSVSSADSSPDGRALMPPLRGRWHRQATERVCRNSTMESLLGTDIISTLAKEYVHFPQVKRKEKC